MQMQVKIKTVNLFDMKLSGNSATNYVLAETGNQMITTAKIMPKEVTITAATVADKTYDGNANATVTEVTIAGVHGNLVKDTDFEVTAALFPDADVDAADVNVNHHGRTERRCSEKLSTDQQSL